MSTIIAGPPCLDRGVAAVDEQIAAGHERRGVAGQIEGGAGDLLGQPEPASRCLGPMFFRASSMSFQRRSIRRVSMAPGEIVLARMFCAAWSAASTFASWIKAPFVAQ